MGEQVRDLSTAVCPAEALGLDPRGLDELDRQAEALIELGLPSCQVAVGRYGRLAMFAAYGAADKRARYATFSSTKVVTHSALWILWGEGKLSPDTVVADVVPEFGSNGKATITVEQVVLQMGGFPHAPLDFVTAQDREARLARFAKWRLNWEPGTTSEYHPTSAHWVLAEVIERLSGRDYREFIKTRVVDPLGLPTLRIGIPVDEQDDIVDLVQFGEGAGAYGDTEASVEHMLNFNTTSVRSLGVPAAGCYSTAADFALLYQAFVHDPYDLWKPEILSDARENVRNTEYDRMAKLPANLTFGFRVNLQPGPDSSYGASASAGAFGWSGAGGQEAWADPATGISFAFFTNGLNRDLSKTHRLVRELATTAGALALGGPASARTAPVA